MAIGKPVAVFIWQSLSTLSVIRYPFSAVLLARWLQSTISARKSVCETYRSSKGGKLMAIFNKDEAEGKWEQAKGTVKDKVGEVTGDRDLEAEGEVQHAEGEAQEGWGSVKRGVSNVVHDIGDAINK
jgi:uncharacterized protein YjbJ (UPF0337 family)